MAGGKQYIALPVGEGPIVDELIVVFFVIGSKCPIVASFDFRTFGRIQV
jgi:hypothetical protein